MAQHDPKILVMPAVILPEGGKLTEFLPTDAARSQLLYSWLRFTGMDRIEEISVRW